MDEVEIIQGTEETFKNNPIREQRVDIVYETRTILYKKAYLENKNESLDVKKNVNIKVGI